MFAPKRFFPQLGRGDAMGPSLAYYFALGILVAGITLFWEMVLPVDGLFGMGAPVQLRATRPLQDFLFSPLTLLFGLLIGGGVVHLMLLLLGAAKNGFTTTLRVFCFAYGPMLFSVVPVVGQVVGNIWMFVLAIVGLREAHGTSTARAAFAVLLPAFVALAFAVFAVLAMRMSGLPL